MSDSKAAFVPATTPGKGPLYDLLYEEHCDHFLWTLHYLEDLICSAPREYTEAARKAHDKLHEFVKEQGITKEDANW